MFMTNMFSSRQSIVIKSGQMRELRMAEDF